MWIIIGGFVLAVVIYLVFGSRKMSRMNNDPKQQELAILFASAGGCSSEELVEEISRIKKFVQEQGWDRVEEARRVAHALSMVKVVEFDIVYQKAIEASRKL